MTSIINLLSLSGGKDSTAMLLWAKEHDLSFRAIFADTGNEHPITYEYLDYLGNQVNIDIQWVKADFTEDMARKRAYIDTKWRAEGIPDNICDAAIKILKPTSIPFLDLCMMKGMFPTPRYRICTNELKIYPISEQVILPIIEKGISVRSLQGVRAQESRSRAKLPVTELQGKLANGAEIINHRPILDWTVEQVFAQHRRHNVKPNPLYSVGMSRVGCMPCIYCRKRELLHIGMRFPEQIDRIEEWEAIVSQASKKGKASFFFVGKHHGENIRQCVEWAKTTRNKKDIDLQAVEDTQLTCSSSYGLCE